MAGTWTSLDASERVALRVGGSAKRRTTVSPESDGDLKSAAEGQEVESSASVELGDWGVRVSLRWLYRTSFNHRYVSPAQKLVFWVGK